MATGTILPREKLATTHMTSPEGPTTSHYLEIITNEVLVSNQIDYRGPRHLYDSARNLATLPIQEKLLDMNVQWFRGGLVLKTHRHFTQYHSIQGLRVIKKKEEDNLATRKHRLTGESWVPREKSSPPETIRIFPKSSRFVKELVN